MVTKNVAAGTVLSYTLAGTNDAAIASGSGNVTVDANGRASVTAFVPANTVLNDSGALTMTLQGAKGAVTSAVAVTDASVAPPVVVPPAAPTYALAASATSVNEGGSVIYTVTTKNVAAGSVLSYAITGDVMARDITGGQLVGTATVGADGTAVFAVGTVADQITDGDERMIITVAGQTNTVTVRDTSQAPVVVPPATATYTVSNNNTASVNEGGTATFVIKATNAAAGSTVAYTLAGTRNAVGLTGAGSATVDTGGNAVVTVNVPTNAVVGDAGTLTLTILNGGATANVAIADISVAQPLVTPLVASNLSYTGSATAANNTFTGTFNTGSATFVAGQTITGGAGVPNSIILTDLATSGSSAPTSLSGVTVSGVQTATLNSGFALTVNTGSTAAGSQGWTGLTQLNVNDNGATTINAAPTTSVTLNEGAAAATATTITGGLNVNATISGVTGANTVTIGGAAAATQPAGTVALTVNTAAQTPAVSGGTIAVTGGTTVSATQSVAAPTSTAAAPVANTAATVSVTGGANTTAVTVTQPTAQASSINVTATAIPASLQASTQVITVNALTATVTTVVNAATGAFNAFTAAQVAQAFAGGTVAGLSLTNNVAGYNFSAPTATGQFTMTAITTAGAQPLAVTSSATGVGVAPVLATSGTGGLYDSAVTITDINGTSGTAAGTIATATINGLSLSAAGAASVTITDNALTTLNISNNVLSPATVTLTNNLTAPGARPFTLNLTNSPQSVTLADTNNELTGLTITSNSGANNGSTGTTVANTLATNGGAAGLTKVTSIAVSGNNTLSMGSLAAMTTLASVTVSGGAGLNFTGAPTTLTSVTSSSSGGLFATATPATTTITNTGTGPTYVTVAAAAARPITASATAGLDNAIIWNSATVPTTLLGTGGSYTNFTTFGLGSSAASGTFNIATLQPAGSTFNSLLVLGGTPTTGTFNPTFTNVTPGTPLSLDVTNSGTVTVANTGTTGASNAMTVNLGIGATSTRAVNGVSNPTTIGITIAALTLQDAATTQTVANGVGTLTVNSNATTIGSTSTITTLNDPSLSTLNISGTGALAIGSIISDVATSLTINNTSSSITASSIGGTAFTNNSLASLTFSGTGATTLTLADTNPVLSITQNSTGATTIATLAGGATLGTLSLAGTGALTISSLTDTGTSFIMTNSNTNTTGLTVTALTDANLTALTLSGTGRISIPTLTVGATTFNLTDTDSGAVSLGAISAAGTTAGFSANAATSETYINGSVGGTLTIVEIGTHTGASDTISLINSVAFTLNDGVNGTAGTTPLTIAGSSDNASNSIFLGNTPGTTAATAQASTTGNPNVISLTSSAASLNIVAGMRVTGTNIPAGDYVTSVSGVTVTLATPPTGAIAGGATLNFGGLNTAATSITLGNGNNVVYLPASANAETLVFGSGNNTVRALGVDSAGVNITATSGNNTILLGVDTTVADVIRLGQGTNTLTYGANHTNAAQLTFTTANAASATSLTTISNIGGQSVAAGATQGAVGVTVTLASTANLYVGEVVRDLTAPAATAGATYTVASIVNGTTITLSQATAAVVTAADVMAFGLGSATNATPDTITFVAAPINSNAVALGAVNSIQAGLAGVSQTQGFTTFTFNGNTYIYENTGVAATSELVSLVGVATGGASGHPFTVAGSTITIIG